MQHLDLTILFSRPIDYLMLKGWMNFKSLILLEMVGNFANFHVRYSVILPILLFYHSQCPIIVSRDWRHGCTLMMKFLLVGRWWEGEGGVAFCVFPTEWHWMIRRVEGGAG